MYVTQKEIKAFQLYILKWYEKNKRNLPWRHPSLKLRNGTRDPYKILVSEVMLQQTQVQRVIPKYEEWMKAFPTVERLAQATTRDVLSCWSGLGYNRRALFLKELAEELVKNTQKIRNSEIQQLHNPVIIWPQTEKELQQLPGIGKYTARALLCFAFNKQVPVVDTNIRKVILVSFVKLFNGLDAKEEQKMIEKIVLELLPEGRAYDWNQALMDYAAAELKQEKIIIPKQSKFRNSDRYYRGKILKTLLKEGHFTKKGLISLFAETIDTTRLEKILSRMEKDALIQNNKKGDITLPQ